jgi:hypothetical protein
VLSPVPVVLPVSRSGVASSGRAAAGDTLTVASRVDGIGLVVPVVPGRGKFSGTITVITEITGVARSTSLVKLVEIPAQGPHQLMHSQ